jgi:serine/threonine protein phosphatase PrpC
MRFVAQDSVSLPADPAKPNEDAFAQSDSFAVVLDGATGLGETLMPGVSDAQWIARFGANRIASYARAREGSPREWLKRAMEDAAKSFAALRRRAPKETYEIAFASMILAALRGEMLQLLWLGDCTALYKDKKGAVDVLGDAQESRERERARVAAIMLSHNADPAAPQVRSEFLPALRQARNTVNTPKGQYLFGPDAAAAAHLRNARRGAQAGASLLLASDGFYALCSDYDAYTPSALMAAAEDKGLAALGEELRAIEMGDAEGKRFHRFKRHDDATAVLLRIEEG